jgi:hypothetical protein
VTIKDFLERLELDLDSDSDGIIIASVNNLDGDATNLKVRGKGRMGLREALQIVQSVLDSVSIKFPTIDSSFDVFAVKRLLGALNEAHEEITKLAKKEFAKEEKEEKEENVKVEIKQQGGKYNA